MTSDAKKLLAAYVKLSELDRNELVREAIKFEKADSVKKTEMQKAVCESVVLGPLGSRCQYCGK